MNYLKHLAAFAAASVKASAPQRAAENSKREPGPTTAELKRRQQATLARVAKCTATSFPNDLGNYRGKRKPKPAGRPLTPRERFFRVVAAYFAFGSSRPVPQQHEPATGREFMFAGERRIERVTAPTKSEARALIKRALGIHSTAGIEVLAA